MLAKGQYTTTHIGRLKNADGTLTSPETINARFLHFCRDLYSSRVTYTAENLSDYLDRIPFPTLDPDKSKDLDREITLEEVQKAMSCMQLGKAPGLDGIPIEFYCIRNCWLLD